MIYKTNLFEVPIYKLKASKQNEIKKWFFENIYSVYAETGFNEPSRSIFSSYFPGAPKLDQDFFQHFYNNEIKKFLNKSGFNREVNWLVKTNFFYNISAKNSWQEVHDHLSGPMPVTYVGIHYLKFDPSVHTGTVFYNPLEKILKSTQPTLNDNIRPIDYQGLQKIMQVEEGDIVIFPSYVSHSVMTQLAEEERITIAFNISVLERDKYE